MANTAAYVRNEDAPKLPAPANMRGWLAWVHQNLFASIGGSILTCAFGLLAFWIIWTVVDWAVLRAVFTGVDREPCAAPSAAC